jgi:hypothetical protein
MFKSELGIKVYLSANPLLSAHTTKARKITAVKKLNAGIKIIGAL